MANSKDVPGAPDASAEGGPGRDEQPTEGGTVAGVSGDDGATEANARGGQDGPAAAKADAPDATGNTNETIGVDAAVPPDTPGDAAKVEASVEPSQAAGDGQSAEAPKEFEIGTRVSAMASFDQTHHPADIIDLKRDEATGLAVSYYVHFHDFNKRLDEWLPRSKLEVYKAAAAASKTPADPAANLPTTPQDASGLPLTPGSGDRKLTRNLKRRYNEIHNVAGNVEDLTPIDQTLEREHEEKTKVKNIQLVECGQFEMDAWYYSPYPDEYGKQSKLYVCEHCLKYMRKQSTLLKHKGKCKFTHPPGTQIYKHPQGKGKPTLAFWELDGRLSKVYCQNLCLLAKLFLDHKTLYYDVEPFLFYVMTEHDEARGVHSVVGYFSKEKYSLEEYNLACILTLPPYQRRGYGSFLIAMSYELSKCEGRVGTPERPLSDLGQVSYRSYWCRVVLGVLHQHKGNISIRDISHKTSIRESDIVSALQSLNLLKYWKGQHIISATPRIIEEHMRSFTSSHVIEINPNWLTWTPPPLPQLPKKR